MITYLSLGIIFGVICAAVASAKNRSPFGWFVIGFIIPVVGVILLLALDEPGEMSGSGIPPLDPSQYDNEPLPSPRTKKMSQVDELERLVALREKGALTDEEAGAKRVGCGSSEGTAMQPFSRKM